MTQMTRVVGPGGNPLRWKYRPKRATVSALSHGWSILEHRGIAGCAIVAAGVATNSEVRSSAGLSVRHVGGSAGMSPRRLLVVRLCLSSSFLD